MLDQKDTINKKLNLQEKSFARRRERFLTFLCSPPPLVLAAEADPKAAASLHAAATYPPRCGLRNPENPSMSRCTDRTALLSRRDGPEEDEEEDAEAATSGRERSSSCQDTNGGSRDTACGPIALKREEKLSVKFGTKKNERFNNSYLEELRDAEEDRSQHVGALQRGEELLGRQPGTNDLELARVAAAQRLPKRPEIFQ